MNRNEDDNAIIPRPDLAPVQRRTAQTQVLSNMVCDTLAIARQERRFKIGEYGWYEPDYRQILIWAAELRLEPDEVIRRLLDRRSLFRDDSGMHTDSANWHATTFREGRIVALNWDLDLLPIADFQWVDGLEIEQLRIVSEPPMATEFEDMLNRIPIERRDARFERSYWRLVTHHKSPDAILVIQLSLPKLRILVCERLRANELDLSNVPRLETLRCGWNRLNRLDLKNVPMLQDLDCSNNKLSGLQFNKSRLRRLNCSGNKLMSVEDVTGPELVMLDCSDNEIIEIDLSDCASLEHLDCRLNYFQELNITALRNLEHLEYGNADADPEEGPHYPQHVRLVQRDDQHFRKA